MIWTEEDKAIAFNLLDNGATAREVGEKLGRSKNSVISLFNRAKTEEQAKRRDMRQFWTDDERQLASELWALDYTVSQIAERLGRPRSAISHQMTTHRQLFPKKGGNTYGHLAGIHKDFWKAVKPTAENTILEYEFTETPVPEVAKLVPYMDLKARECKWLIEDFWHEPSSESICCGLAVLNYKGSTMQRNYCEQHYLASIKKDP